MCQSLFWGTRIIASITRLSTTEQRRRMRRFQDPTRRSSRPVLRRVSYYWHTMRYYLGCYETQGLGAMANAIRTNLSVLFLSRNYGGGRIAAGHAKQTLRSRRRTAKSGLRFLHPY